MSDKKQDDVPVRQVTWEEMLTIIYCFTTGKPRPIKSGTNDHPRPPKG